MGGGERCHACGYENDPGALACGMCQEVLGEARERKLRRAEEEAARVAAAHEEEALRRAEAREQERLRAEAEREHYRRLKKLRRAVPFCPVISPGRDEAKQAADHLNSMTKQWEAEGWTFSHLETVTAIRNNGCLAGLFGNPTSVVAFQIAIIERFTE